MSTSAILRVWEGGGQGRPPSAYRLLPSKCWGCKLHGASFDFAAAVNLDLGSN
ncbi:MAG: hypothetical protein ACYDCL_00915 [Myxococcales bacterium]